MRGTPALRSLVRIVRVSTCVRAARGDIPRNADTSAVGAASIVTRSSNMALLFVCFIDALVASGDKQHSSPVRV